eukprot:1951870-Rhodomonas_salina.2
MSGGEEGGARLASLSVHTDEGQRWTKRGRWREIWFLKAPLVCWWSRKLENKACFSFLIMSQSLDDGKTEAWKSFRKRAVAQKRTPCLGRRCASAGSRDATRRILSFFL